MLFLTIQLLKTHLVAGVYLVFPPRSIQMVFHTKLKILFHARIALLLIRIFKTVPLFSTSSGDSSDRKINSTSSSASSSQTLITAYGHPKPVRLPDSYCKEMKDLVVRWICKDMRPFAIVNDAGFREIAQRCVSIGNLIFY
jgi:hypothetical protein